MNAKSVKAYAPPKDEDSAKIGNVQEIIAAMIQCVKLPRVWPCARTLLGKISDMKTQITAP